MKPPITREKVLKHLKDVLAKCQNEEMQRTEVKQTKEFQAAQKDAETVEITMRELATELAAVRERQAEMLAAVPNSLPELEDAKKMLMGIMEAESVEGYNEDWIVATGRFSEKKAVDGNKLLSILGGDIEEFTKLAQPSQKAVKDYAQEHPHLKKSLLSCITLESRELVGVDVQIPETF